MRFVRSSLMLITIPAILGLASCSALKPKSGCPSNGKNVGAERILSGEKVPKAKKFKA